MKHAGIREEKPLEIVEKTIGADATAALLSALGGSRIVIPQKVGEHHPIAQAVGLDAARMLTVEMAGMTVDLPVTARKRALIVAALGEGLSAYRIANRYTCSPRFVYKVQAELRAAEPPKQMGLF